jgi:hypothetical protein
MAEEHRGFGKPPEKTKPKVSKRSAERARSAARLDKMRADGLPEYEIYLRIKGQGQWYPVGALAVQRSNMINRAIFDSEASLLQGAFRLLPILKKNQENLEFGYRLKEFPDEPITLAVKPADIIPSPIRNAVDNISRGISNILPRKR